MRLFLTGLSSVSSFDREEAGGSAEEDASNVLLDIVVSV